VLIFASLETLFDNTEKEKHATNENRTTTTTTTTTSTQNIRRAQ